MAAKFNGMIAGLVFFVPGASLAHHVDMTDRAARVLGNYEVVGEAQECAEGRLRKTQVVDDHHLIFRMRGNVRYLAELVEPGDCQGLWKYQNYSVETTNGQYCRGGVVSASKSTRITGGNFPGDIQAQSLPGGSCHLGDFYKLERKKQSD